MLAQHILECLAGDFFSFQGNRSDWSNTQTVTIGNLPLASPSGTTHSITTNTISNPTSTPTVSATASPIPPLESGASQTIPELSWLVIVPLLLSAFAVAVILKHKTSRSRNVDEA